ncbi:hypothetical protein D3C76_1731500 [compost metagenome]
MIAAQRQVLAGFAVSDQLSGEAGFAEALAQVLAGAGLVFDNQQFHAVSGIGGVVVEMIRDYLCRRPN